jgi:hypothetical protein
MTKDTTKEAALAVETLLLDDWFDAIDDGIRARARGFIETMLDEGLSEALSRPRSGRRKPVEDEAAPPVVGVRQDERTLTGAFGKTRIAVPLALAVRASFRHRRSTERLGARVRRLRCLCTTRRWTSCRATACAAQRKNPCHAVLGCSPSLFS